MDNNIRLTLSQIKYILWIHRLSKNENGVKNVELATALGVSKPSVHNMLKYLAEINLVRHEFFGLAFFTEEGRSLAEKYAYCYGLLEDKILDICGKKTLIDDALCGLLAGLTIEMIEELYDKRYGCV